MLTDKTINPEKVREFGSALHFKYSTALSVAKPMWSELAMEVPSTGSANTYKWFGDLPGIREWIGDRVINALGKFKITIENKPFENTVAIDKDDFEDDEHLGQSVIATAMGTQAAMFPDKLTYGLLKEGFSTKCYDGQNFFDTDHPVLDADGNTVSVSNSGGGSGKPWFLLDATKGYLPLIFQKRRAFSFQSFSNMQDFEVFKSKKFYFGTDGRMNVGFSLWQLMYGSKQPLNADNFKAARKEMSLFPKDGGEPLGITASVLFVGPSLVDEAEDLMKKKKVDGGDTNTLHNAIKIVVIPELG